MKSGCSRKTSRSARCDPMKPAPPVSRILSIRVILPPCKAATPGCPEAQREKHEPGLQGGSQTLANDPRPCIPHLLLSQDSELCLSPGPWQPLRTHADSSY